MRKISSILLLSILVVACNDINQPQQDNKAQKEFKKIRQAGYELYQPSDSIKAVLILFGGFPETVVDIKREFKILEEAKQNSIAVLFMNFNQRLWLEQDVADSLTTELQKIFVVNKLPDSAIYIGGFSSGGNISLLLSNHLTKNNHPLSPKGVFIVDSPIDLLKLYKTAQKNIARNFSETSIQEATWLINLLETKLGDPENGIAQYEKYSPFIAESGHIENIAALKQIKMRLYTEPDTLWWKENRQNEPEDLNAFCIQQLAVQLKNQRKSANFEFIATQNRGYRANGDRHPHAWSIVDEKELVTWMLDK